MTMGLFLLIAISVASLISISDAAPAESSINEAGNLAGHKGLKASILARRKRSPFPTNNGLFGIPKPASREHVEGGVRPDARKLLLTHTKGGVGTNAGAGEAGWKTPTSGGQIYASSNIGTGTVGGGIEPAIGVDPPKYGAGAGVAVDLSGAGFVENLPRPVSGVGIDPGFSGGGAGGGIKPPYGVGIDTGFSGSGSGGGTKLPVGVGSVGWQVGGSAGHGAVEGSGGGEAAWIGSPGSGGGGGGGEGGGVGWRVGGSAGHGAATGRGARSIGRGIGGRDGGGGGGGVGRAHIGGGAPKPEAALVGHGGGGIGGGGISGGSKGQRSGDVARHKLLGIAG